MQETRVWFLGWEDFLEKEMATHSSILDCRIPRTEEPGRLQSIGSKRVKQDWSNLALKHTVTTYPALHHSCGWTVSAPVKAKPHPCYLSPPTSSQMWPHDLPSFSWIITLYSEKEKVIFSVKGKIRTKNLGLVFPLNSLLPFSTYPHYRIS